MRKLVRENLHTCPEVLTLKDAIWKLRYFCFSMVSLLLSMLFPVVEYQLLTLSIITGLKWIVDSRKANIVIMERS